MDYYTAIKINSQTLHVNKMNKPQNTILDRKNKVEEEYIWYNIMLQNFLNIQKNAIHSFRICTYVPNV